MTRWEFFESGYGLEAMELGLIKEGLFQHYIRYKTYKEYCEVTDVGTAVVHAADQCCCAVSTMYKAIRFFKPGFRAIGRDSIPNSFVSEKG